MITSRQTSFPTSFRSSASLSCALTLACSQAEPTTGVDDNRDLCATGHMQSPIDLPAHALRGSEDVVFAYQPDDLRIVDNGHTIQINHDQASELRVDGKLFVLSQYHFHSPSEHAEVGSRHALELHLVHTDDSGNFAVVAVFLDPSDAENRAHDPVWRHLPVDVDGIERVYDDERVNPAAFLPSELTHYRYSGSLTTPPCTETVTWLVMRQPVFVTAEHIDAFRDHYRANARPLQPRPDWCLDQTSHAAHSFSGTDHKP